ncbi:MAG: class I SAM-dependent methyltransferase [Acidimicrobiia bacterium]
MPRTSWDTRYRERTAPIDPSAFVRVEVAPLLPAAGRALDLAGGAGRHAIWLAARGWDTTMVDTSEAAIDIAEERATDANVDISFVHADLTVEEPPAGPWDLVLIVHYLQRDLFPKVIEQLADNGLLAFSIATKRNLERHERPGLPYVLDEGEAPSLVEELNIIHYAEGWSIEDRHEARLVARKQAGGLIE